MPNYLRYSTGEMVIANLTKIGWLIYKANGQDNNYVRVKLATEADNLYQETKFQLRLLTSPSSLQHRREYLFKLETDFGNYLGGWLKTITGHGAR